MKSVIEPQRETPVFAEADVIVVGGGPAGIGAALASARNGAKTILIERFGSLGGMQSQAMSSSFSLVDPDIHGGIIMEVIRRLKEEGAVIRDTTDRTRTATFTSVQFNCEHYKYILDKMMLESGVKLLYHTFAVGGIREGNTLKGVLIECIQGRFAIMGKVIIDVTGNADIAWKSGAACFEGGHPRGPKKGRHMGFGCRFYISGVDDARYKKFRDENPDEWKGMYVGKKLVSKAIAEGKYHGYREAIILHTVRPGIAMCEGLNYPLPLGHHGWMIEDVTAGEIDLRKQVFSLWRLLKDNVPGFENSSVEKLGTIPILRDTHRIVGEYVLTEEDMYQGRAFEDSIAVSNMGPDIYGPDGEHEYHLTLPHDIPYRCLLSRDIDNLMAAGATLSADFYAWAADRYSAPSICTGQAAGTAAALAVKAGISPKKLDARQVQQVLRKQGVPVTVKDLPAELMETYRKRLELEKTLTRL